jgi:hypothetical protein
VSRDENGNNGFQLIDQKNLELLEHIFACFNLKKNYCLAISHLTITLGMISYRDRSLSSISVVHEKLNIVLICCFPDEEVKRDNNCWMIAAIFSIFLLTELTLRLLLLWES